MPWVAELNGRDLPNSEPDDEAIRFALGEGIAFTDAPHVPSGLIGWRAVGQGVDIGATGTTSSTASAGTITIANIPRDVEESGPYDDLLQWAFRGRTARLYYVPGVLWSAKTLFSRGVLGQPGTDANNLVFQLGDPRAELDKPLLTTKYAGDNVPPDGVQGTGDLKGLPIPAVEGTLSNWAAVLVNPQKLIWQVHDGAGTVLCVRDGAVPLAASTSRANVASLEANAPDPGFYDYTSVAGGTYVRLGSTPVFQMAFDVQVGATEANRTHAQVWKRLRTDRIGTDAGDINGASVTALDALLTKEVGFVFREETCRDALDRVLASASGFEVQNLAGAWLIRRLVAPSGTPVINLVQTTPDTAMGPKDRALLAAPERAWPAYAPEGAPPYRVNVNWGQNHTVMQASDFAGVAAERLKDKFSREWRTETATDTDIWDPSDGSGAFPNSPELTLFTGYQPGADTLTCPHAEDEAADRLALYGAMPMKAQFDVRFQPQPGDEILPGDVVSLTHPRYGLDTGPLFLVLQSNLTVEREEPVMNLILGLQT